ncbi:hypothetical protein [Paraburkholderia sp. C35]|uniref:hypothetical protein n=1 Tax=Paraburkholderia sp. C35 TaxID=2126993 RepID=UPI000D685A3C|nr:hypothetical protein [Paraburkholderia sp. C35]
MNSDIPTIETARVALFYKQILEITQNLEATQTATAQTAEKLEVLISAVSKQGVLPEHAKQLIDEAIARVAEMIKDDPIWEERYKKMGEEVHFNGYAELATLVEFKKKEIEHNFSTAITDALAAVELQVSHLKDAVTGRSSLPILATESTLGQKIGWHFAKAAARLHRWCISAMPLHVFIVAILLTLMLGKLFFPNNFSR